MAGWLLVLGSVSFIVGAANPALGQVWSAPLDDQLRLIHGAATAWTITNVLFLGATVFTAAGLWSIPERVGERGQAAARAVTVVYLIAATAWIAALVFRLTVTPSVAASFVAGSSIDPTYITTNLWAEGLFGAFTYLVGGSLVALGVAIVLGGSLSKASGWFAIVIGCGIAVGYAILGDMPPFVAYLPTGVLGVVAVQARA